eukprot:5922832-Alexandrium_andersonii.AAC.1
MKPIIESRKEEEQEPRPARWRSAAPVVKWMQQRIRIPTGIVGKAMEAGAGVVERLDDWLEE